MKPLQVVGVRNPTDPERDVVPRDESPRNGKRHRVVTLSGDYVGSRLRR